MRTNTIFRSLSVAALTFSSTLAFAHSQYIEPSHTSLSGERAPYVSFDLSIAEDLFHPDLALGGEAMNNSIPASQEKVNPNVRDMLKRYEITKINVISPDGTANDQSPVYNVGRKSVSGFKATSSGTYRIVLKNNPTYITKFVKADGEKGRYFGQKNDPAIPADATDRETLKIVNHVETFITRNEVSIEALKPFNKAIEIDPSKSTHPNDLFITDNAKFYFLLNGKPLKAGVKAELHRAGSRYRNQPLKTEFETDKDGAIEIKWPEAGMYFLTLSVNQKSTDEQVDNLRYKYGGSFEVFP